MIQINENIRIVRFDTLNLTIEMLCEVTSKKTGIKKMQWKVKGYYGDLKSAIGGVLKHCLMELSTEEISSLSELIEKIDKIEKELKGVIKDEI